MRDDFTEAIKKTLAKRVGFRCSNPDCNAVTTGPHSNPDDSINVGVAAHIRAASSGGKRYDKSQSREERKSISNAIWLCQKCAKLVASDEISYTVDSLTDWKNKAEQKTLFELEGVVANKLRNDIIVYDISIKENNSVYDSYHKARQIMNALKSGVVGYDKIFLSIESLQKYFPKLVRDEISGFEGNIFYWYKKLDENLKILAYCQRDSHMAEICSIKVPAEWNGYGIWVRYWIQNDDGEFGDDMIIILRLVDDDTKIIEDLNARSLEKAGSAFLAAVHLDPGQANMFYDLAEERYDDIR